MRIWVLTAALALMASAIGAGCGGARRPSPARPAVSALQEGAGPQSEEKALLAQPPGSKPAAVPDASASAVVTPVFITAVALIDGDEGGALRRQVEEGLMALWRREERPGRVEIIEVDEVIGTPGAGELAELLLSGHERANELAAAKGARLLIWGAVAKRAAASAEEGDSAGRAEDAKDDSALPILLATITESEQRPCGSPSSSSSGRLGPQRMCDLTSSITVELCDSEWAAISPVCGVTQSAEP